ncbi:MAG TPA: rRNA maturation RNase YbeY [Candidatus Saccharimonadales bacterium]|nr:rRNA maturation RNase YbeY [Candidatus Saccharimonadales bacterium]
MPKLVVDFTNETTISVDLKPLQGHLEKTLERLNETKDLAVELTIIDQEKIQQLNRDFLQHDYPTDVLSFLAPEEPTLSEVEGPSPLGSIAICLPVAQKQATDAGITLEDELKVLAGHSLLHLLGFHHK